MQADAIKAGGENGAKTTFTRSGSENGAHSRLGLEDKYATGGLSPGTAAMKLPRPGLNK